MRKLFHCLQFEIKCELSCKMQCCWYVYNRIISVFSQEGGTKKDLIFNKYFMACDGLSSADVNSLSGVKVGLPTVPDWVGASRNWHLPPTSRTKTGTRIHKFKKKIFFTKQRINYYTRIYICCFNFDLNKMICQKLAKFPNL